MPTHRVFRLVPDKACRREGTGLVCEWGRLHIHKGIPAGPNEKTPEHRVGHGQG